MNKRLVAAALWLAVAGCGGEAAEPAATTTSVGTGGSAPSCEADTWQHDDGSCVSLPYLPGCPPGTYESDGSCVEAGVPPELCGAGFVGDDEGGCVAVAPEGDCDSGQMAPLGSTTCAPVGDCGEGTWGAIPPEEGTQYVDSSYAGVSDGSQGAPWVTIQQGVDAAAEGAIVAVAAGTYEANVDVDGKAIRIWGRCPQLVEVVGTATPAIFVRNGAEGTQLRGLAVRNDSIGIAVWGSANVLLDEMYLHDLTWRAVQADAATGPTSLTIRHSLVERASDVGIIGFGATITIEESEVRDTRPEEGTNAFGRALGLQFDPESGQSSNGVVRSVVLRNNRDAAIWVSGSTLLVEDSWIVDTQPRVLDEKSGVGIASAADGAASIVEVRSSVVERQHQLGVYALSSELILEGVTIRDIEPQLADGEFGRGVAVETTDSGPRSRLEVRRSLVANTRQIGIDVTGGDYLLDGVLVRDTGAQQSNRQYGRALAIQDHLASGERSEGAITDSTLTGFAETGLFIVSSDATVEGVAIREATTLTDSVFGDGIILFVQGAEANATLRKVHVDRSARAAVASFGGTITLETSLLECNPIDLNGDDFEGNEFSFADEGGNVCGCEALAHDCQLQSSDLEPPDPV